MRDFAHQLDERLQSLVPPTTFPAANVSARVPGVPLAGVADRPEPDETEPRRSPKRRTRQIQAALGSVTAIATVVASAALLSGTSAAGLPVLRTPVTGATGFVRGVRLSVTGIDLRKAHVVRSDQGTAAILTNATASRTCLAIPDPLVSSAPIGTCARTAAVERRGLLVQALAVEKAGQPAPHGAIAFILPERATDARLFDGVEDLHPEVRSGVVLAYPSGAATLRYELHGHTTSIAIPGPFVGETGWCVNPKTGKLQSFTPTTLPGSNAGGAPGHLSVSRGCAVQPGRPR